MDPVPDLSFPVPPPRPSGNQLCFSLSIAILTSPPPPTPGRRPESQEQEESHGLKELPEPLPQGGGVQRRRQRGCSTRSEECCNCWYSGRGSHVSWLSCPPLG